MILNSKCLRTALEYNLDHRRIGRCKPFTLYSTVSSVSDSCVLLIVQVVTNCPDADSITPDKTNEYYVEYVAYFKK